MHLHTVCTVDVGQMNVVACEETYDSGQGWHVDLVISCPHSWQLLKLPGASESQRFQILERIHRRRACHRFSWMIG